MYSLPCGLSPGYGQKGLLSGCGAWAFHCSGFSYRIAGAPGHANFSSYGTWAQQLRLPGSSAQAQQLRHTSPATPRHVGSGIKPLSLALVGKLFTTEPPGNSLESRYFIEKEKLFLRKNSQKNYLKKEQMYFEISEEGAVTFYTPSQCIRMPTPSCYCHMLLIGGNFIDWKRDLFVAFIRISLIASDVETVYPVVRQSLE